MRAGRGGLHQGLAPLCSRPLRRSRRARAGAGVVRGLQDRGCLSTGISPSSPRRARP
ncbi:hypothetical protein STXM2123_707 [Streptomyces sp. F-3]|nr:hypothetical protein STXM2123_707 [Streptomyces sp. F-3]